MGLLSELIAADFFNKPKELGAVRLALEEQGHFYPTTTLSPIMPQKRFDQAPVATTTSS